MKLVKLLASGLLCGSLLVCWSKPVRPQEPEPPRKVWETRTQNLTESLVADAAQLNKSDQALLWARLGLVWFKHDSKRAREWFTRAIDAIEAPTTDKTEAVCKRTSARMVLGMIASRDRALAKRLIPIIDASKNDQTESERLEHATALADAAIDVVNTDSKAALAFAEDSLKIGISFRLGTALWRLQRADPIAGEKLFLQILELARTKVDNSLFGMLSVAVRAGPFSADKYKRLLVGAVADVIAQSDRVATNEVLFCTSVPLLPPLLSDFDKFLPEFSQRVKAQILRCQQVRGEKPKVNQNNSDVNPPPRTVEELLRAASETRNQSDRVQYLAQAAQQAAAGKDFDHAIRILDSMEQADKEFLGDGWGNWRWDYSASSACGYRKSENFQTMNKVIDDTPLKLRGFVRTFLASNCEAFTSQAEKIALMESARKDLERAEIPDRPRWFMSLVRVYIKFSLETAPEVLTQAVASINRAPSLGKDECPTIMKPTVLSHPILLDQYKLPATLLEADEARVLNTIRSVQPHDIRAALRLQLLAAALESKDAIKR